MNQVGSLGIMTKILLDVVLIKVLEQTEGE
jgi:hypothetical protein